MVEDQSAKAEGSHVGTGNQSMPRGSGYLCQSGYAANYYQGCRVDDV